MPSRLRTLTLALPLALLIAGAAVAQAPPKAPPVPPAVPPAPPKEPDVPPPPPEPNQARKAPVAQQLVGHYKKTKHWALKAIVLMALEQQWHPLATEIVLDALSSRDARLRAFGLEALRRSDDTTLRTVASPELIDVLIKKRMADRHVLYRERLLEVLGRILPEGAGNKTKSQWMRYWTKARTGYAPQPYKPAMGAGAVIPGGSGSAVPAYVSRALDLSAFGIELVISIDTTGSMQPTIDAARDGLTDIVAVLKGLAPYFRMGLVTYNDPQANLDAALTPNVRKVQASLARKQANGGGDFPEAVTNGLENAYSAKMGWTRPANKIVIIIGDAPCHRANQPKAIALAKQAYEVWGGKGKDGGKQKVELTGTGRKRPGKKAQESRPIITCGICIGGNGETQQCFEAISKAGGGACEIMNVAIGDPRNPTKGPPPDVSGIVERIIALSFGVGHSEQTRAFVKVYLEYRKAKLYR